MQNINKIIEEQKEEFDREKQKLKDEIREIPDNTCPDIDKLIRESNKVWDDLSYLTRNSNGYESVDEFVKDLPYQSFSNDVESIAEDLRKDNEKLREIGKFWYENYESLWDWHKQSIKQILEAMIEKKKGMKKQIGFVLTRTQIEEYGYNQALDEDITYLINIINNLK